MADQIAAAFTTWIRLECQRQPVLLVVEDLHAADVASVRLLEGLVPALRDQPLFLLALARPELEGSSPSCSRRAGCGSRCCRCNRGRS